MPRRTHFRLTRPSERLTQHTPQTGGPLRVLIVDDHAFFRRGIRDVIAEEPDMRVVGEASDGEQAVRLARKVRPDQLDLVLCDRADRRRPSRTTHLMQCRAKRQLL